MVSNNEPRVECFQVLTDWTSLTILFKKYYLSDLQIVDHNEKVFIYF